MKTIPAPDLLTATPLTPAQLNAIRFGRHTPAPTNPSRDAIIGGAGL